jgi:hypothetical protein
MLTPLDAPREAAAPKLLYSLAETAAITSLSERFIWGLANAGDLPSVSIGQRVLVRAVDLDRWVAAGCPHPNWTAAQAAKKAERDAKPAEPKPRKRRRRKA